MEEKSKINKQFDMGPVGKMLFRQQSPSNPQTVSFGFEIDGRIELNDLINICNNKFLKFDRMKSRITSSGKFEIIENYNCRNNIFEYKLNLQFPENNRKLSNKIVLSLAHADFDSQIVYKLLPLWNIKLYQYLNNKSVIVFSMHHCIGDGNTYFDLVKLLCNQTSNLSNNTQLINKNNTSKYRFFIFIKHIYNSLIFIYRFLFLHVFKYFWNKLRYRNKVYVFEPYPLNGKNSACMTEINNNNVKLARKYLVKYKHCVKHTYNDFMLTIFAESLIHFMKTHMHLTDIEIPPEISIVNTVNLRPFYDNFQYETVFGNTDGAYHVMIPLNPHLSFNNRLKIIQSRINYSKSYNESYYSFLSIKYFWSRIPIFLLKYFLTDGAKLLPVIISGVKEYGDKNWKINNKKLLSLLGGVPLTPGIPLSLGYLSQPNHNSVCVSAYLDTKVCGEKGAEYMVQSLEHVFKKYGVQPNKPKANL